MITRIGFLSTALILFISFTASVFSQKNTVNVKIDGMMCQAGCAMFIESELEKMKGVVEASIDFNKAEGEIILKKRTSESNIISQINNLKGGAYKASVINNVTNQNILKSGNKSCSKGKSCCQKTGKKVASCDNKTKGCCSGGSSKKNTSISQMNPGHSGCTKACCASKK